MRYVQTEQVAHARPAAGYGCLRCAELVARHDGLIHYAHPGEQMTDAESEELDELFNEMTLHMTLEDDLEGPGGLQHD